MTFTYYLVISTFLFVVVKFEFNAMVEENASSSGVRLEGEGERSGTRLECASNNFRGEMKDVVRGNGGGGAFPSNNNNNPGNNGLAGGNKQVTRSATLSSSSSSDSSGTTTASNSHQCGLELEVQQQDDGKQQRLSNESSPIDNKLSTTNSDKSVSPIDNKRASPIGAIDAASPLSGSF